jgi:3-oxosteroid 1-dehydrogenase
MRDAHHPIRTSTAWSMTPGSNTGDGIRAGQAIGAQAELLEEAWWFPVIQLPLIEAPDKMAACIIYRLPHMVCVNRLGDRFTNEACAYDRFGRDMIRNQIETGANAPAWMIFDATFRAKYTCGTIMPSSVMPDRWLPPAWWDAYLYRAPTVAELARKIEIDPAKLESVVQRINDYAASGVDPEFGRGSTEFDRMMAGDPRVKPNPALGPIDRAPFYAVRIELGDLGTKGGLRVDEQARVVATDGQPIPGLYAAGNCTGSIFGRAYPGPGGTLGPAMTFGYIAANSIAARGSAGGQALGSEDPAIPAGIVRSSHDIEA